MIDIFLFLIRQIPNLAGSGPIWHVDSASACQNHHPLQHAAGTRENHAAPDAVARAP
jgi:hypothetical protein